MRCSLTPITLTILKIGRIGNISMKRRIKILKHA